MLTAVLSSSYILKRAASLIRRICHRRRRTTRDSHRPGEHTGNIEGNYEIPKIFHDVTLTAIKGYVAALVLWSTANTAVKISILHFYLTIFGSNTSFRYIVYATMTLVIFFGIGNTLVAFLICRPFAKNWNPLLPGVYGSTIDAVLATSIINVTVELMIITMLMPMIWRLQMAARRKIALTITFGLGFTYVSRYPCRKRDNSDRKSIRIITILRIVLGTQI